MAIVISLYSAFKEEHFGICWCWNYALMFSQLFNVYVFSLCTLEPDCCITHEPSHNWQQSDHLKCFACIIRSIITIKIMSIMSTLIKINTFVQSAQAAEVNMVYSNSGASHFRDHYTVNSTWKSQWVLWSGDGFMQVERQRQNERQCECESSASADCE